MNDETPPPPAPTKAEKRAAQPAPIVKAKARPTLDALRASVKPPAWLHDAAAALHGWNNYSTTIPRLEPSDYAKALDAAKRPGASGAYEPHAPALSETAKERAKARRSK